MRLLCCTLPSTILLLFISGETCESTGKYVCTRCVTYSIFPAAYCFSSLCCILIVSVFSCLSRSVMSDIFWYYLLDILFLICFINLSSSNNCMCGEGGIALVHHGTSTTCTLFLRLTFRVIPFQINDCFSTI